MHPMPTRPKAYSLSTVSEYVVILAVHLSSPHLEVYIPGTVWLGL
jgi:hypothetical protein